MSANEWGLIESFYIDHGELDGLRPNECFVLGFEFKEFLLRLDSPEPFDALAHSENRDRIQAAADKRGRPIHWTFANDDGWVQCASADGGGGA